MFNQQVRERLLAIPGVSGATAVTPLPLDGTADQRPLGHRDRRCPIRARFRQANFHVVLPGYFETLHTRLIAGRFFTEADNDIDQKTDLPRQIIIDDSLAALAFRGEPAVGKRLLLRITTPEAEWYEVIGVVAHQRHSSLAPPGPEAIFVHERSLRPRLRRHVGGAHQRRSEPDRRRRPRGRGAGRSARAARRDSADDGVRRQGDGADPVHDDADRDLRGGGGDAGGDRALRRAVDDRRASAPRRSGCAWCSARRARAS